MLELLLKSALAYLLGSVMGAMIAGRLRGVDIRLQGSGNAGGTNALRTQGWGFAALVVVVDVGKGALAVGVVPGLALPGVVPAGHQGWVAAACAMAVVAGHVWPVYHQFRGGKGAATVIGALLVLQPVLILPLLAIWLVAVMLWGMVGLGTILAALGLPLAAWLWLPKPSPPLMAFLITMALFIPYTHRSNLRRMLEGTENRVRRLWLLRPRDQSQP
ncbi:MAG: glycerol-3-phosphate 1-O-acyltransferase PlsY [Steroidobacteraceae bacterium]